MDPVQRLRDRLKAHCLDHSYRECEEMVSIARMLNDERAAWRQYACAAMAGGAGPEGAALRACEMVALEAARFDGEGK